MLAGLREHRRVLLTDTARASRLVRVASAAGDREQAALIVTAIGEVVRGNPTLAFIRALAEHAQGLLTVVFVSPGGNSCVGRLQQ
jgi:hypothetical protein